jgi:hypothetical protein
MISRRCPGLRNRSELRRCFGVGRPCTSMKAPRKSIWIDAGEHLPDPQLERGTSYLPVQYLGADIVIVRERFDGKSARDEYRFEKLSRHTIPGVVVNFAGECDALFVSRPMEAFFHESIDDQSRPPKREARATEIPRIELRVMVKHKQSTGSHQPGRFG